MLIAIKYTGKASSEKLNIVAAVTLVAALNIPIMKGHDDSVSGFCHVLAKVGAAANPSLMIEKTIAIFGSLVTYQRINAKADNAPQK